MFSDAIAISNEEKIKGNLIKFRDFDYTVSSTGSIKRIKTGKLIKQGNVNGYKNVCLSKNGKHHYFRVHRMVAELFLKKTGEVVNHKNGIKDDNRVENLEWCTHSENLIHSYRVLGNKVNNNRLGKFGKDNPASKPVIQLDLSGNILREYYSAIEICRMFNYDSGSLCKAIKSGKTAYGFKWKRKEIENTI